MKKKPIKILVIEDDPGTIACAVEFIQLCLEKLFPNSITKTEATRRFASKDPKQKESTASKKLLDEAFDFDLIIAGDLESDGYTTMNVIEFISMHQKEKLKNLIVYSFEDKYLNYAEKNGISFLPKPVTHVGWMVALKRFFEKEKGGFHENFY